MRDSTQEVNNLKNLANVMYLGVTRTFFGLPFEHPFDVMKTKMQANSTTAMETIRKIHSRKKLRGFYSGFWMNSLKIGSKQLYRWPLMAFLTAYFEKSFRLSQVVASILTGVTIAFVDVLILNPFQRIKISQMTSVEYSSVFSFFKINPVSSLYQGFIPYFAKQTASWITFLTSTASLKSLYRQIYNMQEGQQFSSRDIIEISIVVALINTAVLMPIDYVKTQIQKDDGKELRVRDIVKQKFKKTGVWGFYIGWEMKLVQYIIHSFFTIAMLEKAINQFRKSYSQ